MAAGQEEALAAVPSGLKLALMEYLLDAQLDGTDWARYRFVAPALGQMAHEVIEGDFAHLCHQYALPDLAQQKAEVSQVVISLSSQALDFGASDPEIVQYFEAFRIENDRCIWEGF